MRSPVAESRRLEIKPLSGDSAGGDEINAKAQRRKGAKRMKLDQSCSPNGDRDAETLPEKHSSPGLCAFALKSF
jgi:hypothetical protein